MTKSHSWEFTCKTCGGHKLNVYRTWTILAGPETETWQEWGPLELDHTWRFNFKEKIENDRTDEGRRWDFTEYTKDNSFSKPVEYEIYEPEENPGNDKFYVNCANCDREIEFGWSHPNRRGGIFPVECSDFNPDGIWPEYRYLDSWQKKGWLTKEENLSKNTNEVEIHGCIVCARTFNVLVVYSPDGRLVDYTVTSPDGHIVPDEHQPLVACVTHTDDEIETAYERWLANKDQESENDEENE